MYPRWDVGSRQMWSGVYSLHVGPWAKARVPFCGIYIYYHLPTA